MTWWIWMTIGFVLLALELFTGFFVAIWFGIGALIIGSIVWIFELAFAAQILLWIVFSVIFIILWFVLIKPRYMKTRSLAGYANAGIVGEIGLATSDIRPFSSGIVRFPKPICGSDRWECLSDTDISNGSRVKIISIEGNFFKVAPLTHSEINQDNQKGFQYE